MTVVATDGLEVWAEDGERPVADDVIRSLGGRAVRGPIDFYNACDPLFRLTADEFFRTNADDPVAQHDLLNDYPFVRTPSGRQFVRVKFVRPGDEPDDGLRRAYVRVRGVPVYRLWTLLAWLIPQIGLTLVGGAASWLRPFDRAARLFYLMSATTVRGGVRGVAVVGPGALDGGGRAAGDRGVAAGRRSHCTSFWPTRGRCRC